MTPPLTVNAPYVPSAGAVCVQSGPTVPSAMVTSAPPLGGNVDTVSATQPSSLVCVCTGLPSTPVAVIGQCAMRGSPDSRVPLPFRSLNLHTVTCAAAGRTTLKLSVLLSESQNPNVMFDFLLEQFE
jgi:hypothetical protein